MDMRTGLLGMERLSSLYGVLLDPLISVSRLWWSPWRFFLASHPSLQHGMLLLDYSSSTPDALVSIRLQEASLTELEVTICATRIEFRMKPATYPYRIKLSSTSFSVVKILVIDPIR